MKTNGCTARENPFATHRVLEVRYRLDDTTWPQLLSRLEGLKYRAALVGPEGAGKTTLLEDLEPHLRERGLQPLALRLDRENRRFTPGFLTQCFAALRPQHVILFDGAEQMNRLAWLHFKQRSRVAGGLVITSHRAGMLPTLLRCATSPQLLDELVSQILERDASELQHMNRVLYVKHSGNLRDALREWYDIYASGNEPNL